MQTADQAVGHQQRRRCFTQEESRYDVSTTRRGMDVRS